MIIDNEPLVTDDQIESLARCLLPEIRRFFDSDEGRREFEAWQTEQTNSKEDNKIRQERKLVK